MLWKGLILVTCCLHGNRPGWIWIVRWTIDNLNFTVAYIVTTMWLAIKEHNDGGNPSLKIPVSHMNM